MLTNALRKIKYKIDRFMIERKVFKFGDNSHIKRGYRIQGGHNIVIGNNVSICEYATISCFEMYNGKIMTPKISIGNNVFSNRCLTLLCASNITIGDDTFLGSFVTISDENHGINPELGSYGKQDLVFSDIEIGKNCWIGDKAIILPGVTIGDYAIVGAGSVVTKSIPAYTISCGNPARPIKKWDSVEKKWRKIL